MTTLLALAVLALSQAPSEAQEPQLIELEEQKQLPHEPLSSLGTTFYQPSELEAPHAEEVAPTLPRADTDPEEHPLLGRVGQKVAWFGIVREDRFVKARGERAAHHELLVEHKYFDGLTDLHQQIVHFAGAGDIEAQVPFAEKELPNELLTLVRCYGTVTAEKQGVPTLELEFVRVWPWNNFAFMDLGGPAYPDRTNKRWRKGLDLPDSVYSARPDTAYYERLLGTRKK
jgi:hypothetical protein